MSVRTLASVLTHAHSVQKRLRQNRIWRFISAHIQEIVPIRACTVHVPSLDQTHFKSTHELTRAIVLTSAVTATARLLSALTSTSTFDATRAKSPISVRHASKVSWAARDFASIVGSTVGSVHTGVRTARSAFHTRRRCRVMNELTRVSVRFAASIAAVIFHGRTSCGCMSRHTREKAFLVAHTAQRCSRTKVCCGDIRAFIRVINLSLANDVRNDSQTVST